MEFINICLEDPENFFIVRYEQCYEADFFVIDGPNSKLVVKGFGSTITSALEDMNRGLSGYNAQTIKHKAAW